MMGRSFDKKEGLDRAAVYEPVLVDWMNRVVLPGKGCHCERNNVVNQYDIDGKIIDDRLGVVKCYIDFKEIAGRDNFPRFYFSNQSMTGWNRILFDLAAGKKCTLLLWHKPTRLAGIIKRQDKMHAIADLSNSQYCTCCKYPKDSSRPWLWLSKYADRNRPEFRPEVANAPWRWYKSLTLDVFDEVYNDVDVNV